MNLTHITWIGTVYAFLKYLNCHNQYYMSITWVAIEFIPYENFITGDNE